VRNYESRKRVLVTGGAEFLGSHLTDRLLEPGHEAVCADNLFTGSKRNIEHLHGHPRFEFIRHDVTFPLYLEVDEIYNLASITIYGEGQQTRSFCYVDDLIEGFLGLMATEEGFPGPVNLGNPGEFTIRQLAEKVIDLTGSKSQLAFRPLPADDPLQRQPDIWLAQEKVGWEPKVPLDQGLRRTIEYLDRMLASG